MLRRLMHFYSGQTLHFYSGVDTAPTPLSSTTEEPFANAEEAWFWGVQCLLARADGARPLAGLGLVARPCTPDDLLRAVDRRHREGRIGRRHLKVLWDYGCRLFGPDRSSRTEAADAGFWDEALDLLGADWRRRGIVA